MVVMSFVVVEALKPVGTVVQERSSQLQEAALVEPSLVRIDSKYPERWALLDKTAEASLEHTYRVLVVVMVQPWQ